MDQRPATQGNIFFKWYVFNSFVTNNTLESPLITHCATSEQHVKRKFSHLGSTSINIYRCICYTFPLSVVILPPSKAHTSPEPCVTLWSLLCGYIAHHSAYHGTRFEFANAVWYTVISKSTQTHTFIQYTGSGDVDFIPQCNVILCFYLVCSWSR